MQWRKHNIWILAFGLLAVLLIAKPALASKLIEPSLSIDIPGLSFTGTTDGSTVTSNFIAAYITAFYKYLIGFSTTIAIVFIMIGGLMYTFGAASSGAVTKAKERIRNAVVGLVLLMSIHILMINVNPQLVILRDLEIDTIDYVGLVAASGDGVGGADTSGLQAAGVDCPGSGDIAQIARGFAPVTYYRFGAKGGQPDYTSETKVAPDGRAYASFCPENSVCTDCSGYVALVATCTGLQDVGEAGGTAGIFASAPKITSCGRNSVTLEDGTKTTLTPGDLVGFKDGDISGLSGGHVWMYIGDGILINAVGAGRNGGAVREQSLKSACNSFSLRLVDRP